LWSRAELQQLLSLLTSRGFEVIGPQVDQGAIVYGPIRDVADLPMGWTDRQEPGLYRLEPRGDDRLFGYVVGPHSWKKYLFPPLTTLSIAERNATGWSMRGPDEPVPSYAFLGVRACELAALRIQDLVFLKGAHVDPVYAERRARALIIAVNCTQAAATCFCTSMETGPECTEGFDLALTEIDGGFTVSAGSDRGAELLQQLPGRTATVTEQEEARQERQRAVDQIERRLDPEGLRDLLLGNLEHPRWSEVAQRCLSCTNCTQVCPTCFCSSVAEVAELTGDRVTRERRWDSCFNLDFSYMNGGLVRPDIRSRYRQWLTHKLGSWHDQFGVSGCVGCGRCITWCPVGIDLVEEVRALRGEVTE
jgi:formate hydrogenlyase subunit 6/NADH:ubiquinone oxidoreductase subunit I